MAQNNNNSPHLSDTGLPASAAPTMSNGQQQQQQGDSRQSYPNPNDFPPQSQYAYPPPNQGAEPYRASPTGSNGSLNLPSLRTLDSLQQQQQQQHMAPPAPMGGSPYYHNQVQSLPHPGYPNVTSDPQGQNMRYALPAGDQRIMSGGRHKKEIKRRTKTGCLTCRKRRIKCDEGQPACRNCQKSKRDCQGYDPIFKQQPGPAAIQPAPSSGPSQGSVPATAHSYGLQPQMMQGYGAQGNMSYDPALSAAASSPNSAQPYDYASAIDPALEAVSAAPIPAPTYSVPAKRAIEDLFARHGDPPTAPTTDPSQSPADIEEAKHLYYSIYAPGLENFLETKWFTAKGGNKLVTSKDMLIQFAVLLKRFAATDAGNPKEMEYTASVEARTVWSLAKMVIAGAADIGNKQSGLVPTPDDPTEATQRLAVFEILLTGAVASTNALTQPVPGSTDHHRLRELEFWFTLGNFVCFPYEDSTSVKAIDDTLAALRNLLDGRENRDVLYSIAVVRALSHRVSEYNDNDTPLHFDENDNKSKLSIAKKFVGDEGEGAGTTNVIRRLCELATRSWTAPPAAAIVPKQDA